VLKKIIREIKPAENKIKNIYRKKFNKISKTRKKGVAGTNLKPSAKRLCNFRNMAEGIRENGQKNFVAWIL